MTHDELEAEFIRLTTEGELDKIRRILCSRRDQIPREVVNEVVQEACLEVINRQQAGGRITNVAGLVMTIAGRMLEKTWQRMVEGFRGRCRFRASPVRGRRLAPRRRAGRKHRAGDGVPVQGAPSTRQARP